MGEVPAGNAHGGQAEATDVVSYRSYVVRVWSLSAVAGHTARAQIEEVQSGHLVELTGELAAEISARISAAFTARGGGSRRCGHGVVARSLIEGEHSRREP